MASAATIPSAQNTAMRARPSRRARACTQCRTAKVRCSGTRPCERCTRRRDGCVFTADETHVSVPERYLRDLEQHAREKSAVAVTAATTTAPGATLLAHPTSASQPGNGRPTPLPCPDAADMSRSRITPAPLTSATAEEVSQADKAGEVHSRNATNDRAAQRTLLPTVSTVDDTEATRNPLLVQDVAYVRGSDERRLLFLGHTSTWSFCRRAFMLLEDNVTSHSPESPLAPLNLDGAAFRLRWQSKAQVDDGDMGVLPPVDHGIFLFHAVKFHLADLVGIIDEANFLRIFDQFQKAPLATARAHILWFVEYLMVLAFGKVFTSSRGQISAAPPGSEFASRAMSLLPDVAFLQDERPALQAIEVLSLIALYLQSIDMRSPAYQYIGQALRLSLHDGLHRQVSEDTMGSDFTARCKTVWWTVYVLDAELTVGLGCPPTMAQDSISITFFDKNLASPSDIALTFRARIARLVAGISNVNASEAYGSEQDSGSDFVRSITLTLHKLAELAHDIDETSSMLRQNGGDTPCGFYNVNMSYHHCIVLATRPLVIWLLARSLRFRQFEAHNPSTPIVTLLGRAAQSATIALLGLSRLVEREMLETFIPYQLEYAFSSAILLSLLGALLPEAIPESAWRHAASSIFDEMVKRGSVVAPMRKAEWEHLEALLQSYRRHSPLKGISKAVDPVSTHNIERAQLCMEPNLSPDKSGEYGEYDPETMWSATFEGFDSSLIGGDDIFALAEQFEVGEFSSASIFE